jgi:hypothetical protein
VTQDRPCLDIYAATLKTPSSGTIKSGRVVPLGATKLFLLMFEGCMFESRRRSRIRERLEAVANVARQRRS